MKSFLHKLVAGRDLSRAESRAAMRLIMSGQVEHATVGAYVAMLAAKGETVDELVGAAEAMQAEATPIRCAVECIDTCGAGGDGISTFNVSTTAAIIAAAAGATVAKHGNVTNTRVSGSAEVLRTLGVNIECAPAVVERCLSEVGIGFLFARRLHPAMKHAAPVRKALEIRTIFNLLGPLTNPAGVRRQVLGVPRPELTETLAEVLKHLGAVRAMVVHGMDGLCDLTITDETRVSELRDGAIETRQVAPEDVQLPRAPLRELMVSSPQESAEVVRRVLSGETGPPRDHALLNAAAALVVADIAGDLQHGVQSAVEAVDDGRAHQTLQRLIEVTNA